jgi:hypothetical protein
MAAFYHGDIEAIKARYVEFYSAMRHSDYKTTYVYTLPEYRRNHALEEFISSFPSAGDLSWLKLTSDSFVEVTGDKAILYPVWTDSWGWYTGPVYGLVKVEDKWYFSGENYWNSD